MNTVLKTILNLSLDRLRNDLNFTIKKQMENDYDTIS